MSRAKEIAAKIINEVWPKYPLGKWLYDAMERAVEKHMLRPHQVKDRDGDVWGYRSDGLYTMHKKYTGEPIEEISESYGPLTEVQGEPLPDAGEIERLKVRIAELEKRSMDLVLSSAEVRGVCGKQRERIAELEKKISEYSRDLIDSKKHVDDLQGWLAEERSILAMRASQLSEMEEDRMSMIETSARLRDLCDRQQKRIAELEKQLADKTESLDSLKSRHYEMSQEIESLNALSPEKASLMSKIDSLEREKQADSIVISTNRRERDDMVNRIVELERQLAEAKAEPAKPTALQEFVDMCRAVVARFGMEGEVPCKWSFILNSAGPFPAI
jgi:DNA repair exonuclease SbcCD ATPase subunit